MSIFDPSKNVGPTSQAWGGEGLGPTKFLIVTSGPLGAMFFFGLTIYLAQFIIWLGLVGELAWFAANQKFWVWAKKQTGPHDRVAITCLRVYQWVMYYTFPLQILFFITVVLGGFQTFSNPIGITPTLADSFLEFIAGLIGIGLAVTGILGGLAIWYNLPEWLLPAEKRQKWKFWRTVFLVFVHFLGFVIWISVCAIMGLWVFSGLDPRVIPLEGFICLSLSFLFLLSALSMRFVGEGKPVGDRDPWGGT